MAIDPNKIGDIARKSRAQREAQRNRKFTGPRPQPILPASPFSPISDASDAVAIEIAKLKAVQDELAKIKRRDS